MFLTSHFEMLFENLKRKKEVNEMKEKKEIVTKKEIVSNSVNHLQKEIDRVLKNRKEFFDGETIKMCFYGKEGLKNLIKNNEVKDELIRRYNEAGWDILVGIEKRIERGEDKEYLLSLRGYFIFQFYKINLFNFFKNKKSFHSRHVGAITTNYQARRKKARKLSCLNPDRALNVLSAREVEFSIFCRF